MRIKYYILFLIIIIFSCNSHNKEKDKNTYSEEVKYQQYYVKGQELYKSHCSNCHQSNGKGLGKLYPTLVKSDFMNNNKEKVFCIIKDGYQGKLIVNQTEYNLPMPGNPQLSELQIAQITTYIYNSWDNNQGVIVTIEEVKNGLNRCNDN